MKLDEVTCVPFYSHSVATEDQDDGYYQLGGIDFVCIPPIREQFDIPLDIASVTFVLHDRPGKDRVPIVPDNFLNNEEDGGEPCWKDILFGDNSEELLGIAEGRLTAAAGNKRQVWLEVYYEK